ncbi:hypothetical protein C8J57DRAFT_1130938 [Mycena rebaudengoi]|nr:hypothetical protein C8J57DRAFT_1130938 [Mycena rebaudengoi]
MSKPLEPPLRSFNDQHFVLNPPAASHTISPDGNKITIRALPKTDWWSAPPPKAIESRTGALFALPIDATRDFSASVWIRGELNSQFDQGCLMLLAEDSNDVKGDWLKAGVELESEQEWIGAVLTSPWSDWAISPAAHPTSTLGQSPHALFMRFVREGPTLIVTQHLAPHITASPPAETDLVKLRKFRGFNVDVEGNPRANVGDKWRIGVMVCGPKNPDGAVAEFEKFSFEYL